MSTSVSRTADDLPSMNSNMVQQDGIAYQTGFGNSFETEALPGALPRGRNNPRMVPLDLYTEQLSGTAFTAPRSTNRRVWLYRRLPSVVGTHTPLQEYAPLPHFGHADPALDFVLDPNPLRWKPPPALHSNTNFVTGLQTYMSSSGSPSLDASSGVSISLYAFAQSMHHQHLYNSDGDFLIVPQQGSLLIYTELGKIMVHPHEIVVLPRGVVFSVHRCNVQEEFARGYVLEVCKGHFQLPELGPIGSNGLVNARDVYHPTAWYDSTSNEPCMILNKFGGQLFSRTSPHSPYNVVAWHGNYSPFKYDLRKFCAVNSVTYDHLDPSIYTVLTVVGSELGTALADFVIFPPRVLATDANTFRPPWFHRNTMSEFMGLISGSYDAKVDFVPGGATLHSTMTPHGPDAASYQQAMHDECREPTKFEGGMAFMFETSCLMKLSRYALSCSHRDVDYAKCWAELPDVFGGKGGKGD